MPGGQPEYISLRAERQAFARANPRRRHTGICRLHRDRLRLRSTVVLATQDRRLLRALGPSNQIVAVQRWAGTEHRLLVANFGPRVSLALRNQPLLLHLAGGRWRLSFSTSAHH